MTHSITELMTLTKSRGWSHQTNPVAEFNFDSAEVRHPPGEPDLIRPDKPKRGKKSDGVGPEAARRESQEGEPDGRVEVDESPC